MSQPSLPEVPPMMPRLGHPAAGELRGALPTQLRRSTYEY
jgi:hypothetical protein